MHKLYLRLDKDSPLGQIAEVIDNGFCSEKYNPTTLKDVSIILYNLCGVGVLENLAKELSLSLNISLEDAKDALWKIIREYSEMDDEEAYKKAYGD